MVAWGSIDSYVLSEMKRRCIDGAFMFPIAQIRADSAKGTFALTRP